MKGTVLYGPRDVRFEERDEPKMIEPTDAIIRISATCVCGSDLWPYRGISRFPEPSPMGHEYCGIVEECGQLGQAGTVRYRIVRDFRQHLSPLSGRLPIVEPSTASSLLGRRRRCCACRWPTGHSSRPRACPRTT
jgi:hypothetical protein